MTDSSVSSQAASCPRCGSRVVYSGRGRRPVWCSQVCRQEAYEARRSAREQARPIEVVVREREPAPQPEPQPVPPSIDEAVAAVIASPMATYRVLRSVEERARRGELEHPKWQRVRVYLRR